MNGRANYVLIGAFVILLSTALVALVLWFALGGVTRSWDYYTVYLPESVVGLTRDSLVTYRGVEVGRVRSIHIDEMHTVRLLLQVQSGVPVKADTVAMVELLGITGVAYINLRGGSPESRELAAESGEPYPVIQYAPSFIVELEDNVTVLSQSVVDAADSLNRLLSEENLGRFSRILAQVEALTEGLSSQAASLGGLFEDASATARALRGASGRLNGLMQRTEAGAEALEKMAEELAGAGGQLRQTVEATGPDVERFTAGALPEAAAAVRDLRQAARNLRELSESLQAEPGMLLFGGPEPVPGPGEEGGAGR